MSDDHDIIVKDLTMHLAERIDTVLGDFVERCSVMDVPAEKMAQYMLTVLCQNVVMLSVSEPISASEPEFLKMCHWHYREEKAHARRK
jgi:hypothetical protein